MGAAIFEKAVDGRAFARELVLRTIRDNQHLKGGHGTAVAAAVTWLALTGSQGQTLREARIEHIGYIITRLSDGEHNFRLIAGGRGALHG
jgi:hypothetical protein